MQTGKHTTVAIADDHKGIRNIVSYILGLYDFSVTLVAADGQTLIEKIKEAEVPDICLLDYNMPYMDGVQTAGHIRENWPSTKIVLFSLSLDKDLQEKALAAGVDACLTKTTDVDFLIDTLRSLGTLHGPAGLATAN